MENVGVRYSEVRWWARNLRTPFTATLLAQVMGVDHEVGRRGILALLYNDVIEATGETRNGAQPAEPEYRYKPLPPGPKEHFTYPPEWHPAAGICGRESFARGMPVSGMSGGKSLRARRQNQSVVGARKKRTQGGGGRPADS